MPGGPVATGGGIGANAPKSKLAGILMVCPLYPTLFSPSLISLFFPKDRFRCIWWYPLRL